MIGVEVDHGHHGGKFDVYSFLPLLHCKGEVIFRNWRVGNQWVAHCWIFELLAFVWELAQGV